MNSIGRELYKSIYMGKWVSIEYRNKTGQITNYWISIDSIDINGKRLSVKAFNIVMNAAVQDYVIYFESILSAEVVDGTYARINEELIQAIEADAKSYQFMFESTVNLSVLDYLEECNRYDNAPCATKRLLVHLLDNDVIMRGATYQLNDSQFQSIAQAFQNDVEKDKVRLFQTQLGLNLLGITNTKGFYVLAYRRVLLNVNNRTLIPDTDVIINYEYTLDGVIYSIHKYLPEEDRGLLDDFISNQNAIIDSIARSLPNPEDITTTPFFIELQRQKPVDLHREYKGIFDMYAEDRVPVPIKAFFGELKNSSRRIKNYPITLIDQRINLDQLLTIHKAMKYPITYVQGPPGTGKTNTIINILISCLFNEKTVLVSSYNNHPMNGVIEKLRQLKSGDYTIPFPAIRLGNAQYVNKALDEIKEYFNKTKKLQVYEDYLVRNRETKEKNAKALSDLLELYEERIDLLERKETIQQLLQDGMPFKYSVDIEAGQLNQINQRLDEIGFISNEKAIALLEEDYNNFIKFVNYKSIKHIQRLKEPKYEEMMKIIEMDDSQKRVTEFNEYLSEEENLRNFLRVFPIVITTNISAHHLGQPKPMFDLTIIDEASQCDNAVALIPIIRGQNLLLVGDPQQLNPVILLDAQYNKRLMQKHKTPKEYNYIENSIYKTYIAVDPISDEILLSYHYRCNGKIIDFNNKKYYNNKLNIRSENRVDNPLIFRDTKSTNQEAHNTSINEAEEVIEYVKKHPDQRIGIITPFVKQKELINDLLEEAKVHNVTCGTVHAFQGDEKDVILFSTAISKSTRQKTYDWLKNNKELINVATSRARDQLILFGDENEINRLNASEPANDFFELVEYIKKNGETQVTSKVAASKALGMKPFSSELEADFMQNLKHALDITNERCFLRKEVPISSIFKKIDGVNRLFYTGRFDFVVFKKSITGKEYPMFAIELNGPEHKTDKEVIERDRKKKEICDKYKLQLIVVENVYARRYGEIKDILLQHFRSA